MQNVVAFHKLRVATTLLIAMHLEDLNVRTGLACLTIVSRLDVLEQNGSVPRRLVSIQSYVKVYLVIIVHIMMTVTNLAI